MQRTETAPSIDLMTECHNDIPVESMDLYEMLTWTEERDYGCAEKSPLDIFQQVRLTK